MNSSDSAAVQPVPTAPEAWLRGPLDGVDPYLMPAAHAFVQAAEELRQVAAGLSHAQLWARPGGAASVGFHLRHVAGATDRLLTYAEGAELTPAQRAFAAAEGQPAGPEHGAEALAEETARGLVLALERLRQTPRERLLEPRGVGRLRLPSNVLGLIFHAAEHAQRHVGQALATAKVVRQA
jgi:hypothetical protein